MSPNSFREFLAAEPIKRIPAEKVDESLILALKQTYLAFGRLDFMHDRLYVLYSKIGQAFEEQWFNWDDALALYAQTYLSAEDGKILCDTFSGKQLRALYKAGEFELSRTLRFYGDKEQWVIITVWMVSEPDEEPYAYALLQDTYNSHLTNDIVESYIYADSDMFLSIDAMHNSYVLVMGNSDTPMPLPESDDYLAQAKKYIADYVVPEDRARVLEDMELAKILSDLNETGVHEFTFGMIEPLHGYHRKRVVFRYQDERHHKVMFRRQDVTGMYMDQKRRQDALNSALLEAQTDGLTHIFNYQGTREHITNLLLDKEASALFFIDLDNFKLVNDTLGHAAGDWCLCEVAQVLRHETRSHDIIGRIGGDEFIVYLSRIKNADNAAECAGRICRAMQSLSDRYGKQIGLTCSIGIALAPQDGHSYEALVAEADRLVYEAKHNGKNSYVIKKYVSDKKHPVIQLKNTH